jgi:hypothetical protein
MRPGIEYIAITRDPCFHEPKKREVILVLDKDTS